MEKRYETHIRMSKSEEKKIKAKANKCKMTLSKYMIESSLNTQIIVEEDKKQFITELRRIGNNINQITKKVNQGILKEINLEEVKQELNKIWQLLSS